MPRAAVAIAVRKRRMPPPPALPVSVPTPPRGADGLYSRDDLLRRFAPLVRHVVERVATTLPRYWMSESHGPLGHVFFPQSLRLTTTFRSTPICRSFGITRYVLRP